MPAREPARHRTRKRPPMRRWRRRTVESCVLTIAARGQRNMRGHVIVAHTLPQRRTGGQSGGRRRSRGDAWIMATRKMKLGLFIRPCGHHIAAWRHPLTQADAGVNFPHFVEMAQIAERGLFDMLFSADNHTVWT